MQESGWVWYPVWLYVSFSAKNVRLKTHICKFCLTYLWCSKVPYQLICIFTAIMMKNWKWWFWHDLSLTILSQVLAVSKIDSATLFYGPQASDNFLKVVSEISHLHHPNVTELVGYCSEHGQYLLAYQFHKNGTLFDYLHLSDEYSKPLIWNSRVKIALGTARALE